MFAYIEHTFGYLQMTISKGCKRTKRQMLHISLGDKKQNEWVKSIIKERSIKKQATKLKRNCVGYSTGQQENRWSKLLLWINIVENI